ncbi:MAG TPA: ROK family protein [Lentisphaeria bacterium]|nr:MAG: hypothetical protein A2X47_13425 [Lentisphaerae bacterium GWF2_38_69]HBM14967.1 ROK family protein [Lentisphaeria bacterium]
MNFLSFDIGGTSIKYGVVDSKGLIIQKDSVKTPGADCKNAIPEIIINIFQELSREYKIEAIGISTAGLIDSEKGIVTLSANLPGYTGCKLKEKIEAKTGVQVFVENDANCAALGEMWKGAAKNNKFIIFLTLGTGVGGACILNGKLYKGFHGFAGEFARVSAASGILEGKQRDEVIYDKTASTSSLVNRYKKLTDQSIDGLELMTRVKAKEESALIVYDDFINSLCNGLDTIVSLFDPEVVVIGGGISAQGDFFFSHLNKVFQVYIPKGYEDVIIKKALLENDAGIFGAAYVCLHKNYIV